MKPNTSQVERFSYSRRPSPFRGERPNSRRSVPEGLSASPIQHRWLNTSLNLLGNNFHQLVSRANEKRKSPFVCWLPGLDPLESKSKVAPSDWLLPWWLLPAPLLLLWWCWFRLRAASSSNNSSCLTFCNSIFLSSSRILDCRKNKKRKRLEN